MTRSLELYPIKIPCTYHFAPPISDQIECCLRNMSGVLTTTRSQIIAAHRIIRGYNDFSVLAIELFHHKIGTDFDHTSTNHRSLKYFHGLNIDIAIKINPIIIRYHHATPDKYNGTVVIFISAIAHITSSQVPTIAHVHATIPANKITIVAKSNSDVGLAKIATPATRPDNIIA